MGVGKRLVRRKILCRMSSFYYNPAIGFCEKREVKLRTASLVCIVNLQDDAGMAKYVFNMCQLQLDFYKSHSVAESTPSPQFVTHCFSLMTFWYCWLPLPPHGHVWDMMLVWRRILIKLSLCYRYNDTSSSYRSVDWIDVHLHTPALRIGTHFLLTSESVVFLFRLLSATSKPFSSLSTRLAHTACLGFFYINVLYKFTVIIVIIIGLWSCLF